MPAQGRSGRNQPSLTALEDIARASEARPSWRRAISRVPPAHGVASRTVGLRRSGQSGADVAVARSLKYLTQLQRQTGLRPRDALAPYLVNSRRWSSPV